MELNADFTQRAIVHAARIDWVPSPMPGVERRMLDRIGDEVARATSIVRYAPGSRFSSHRHGGGEEFLVLEGVFQDEHGDYPEGYYVRNPPNSRHSPGSETGCVLFVKLWQFEPEDRTHVRIDTRDMPYVPDPNRPGVEVMPLFRDTHEDVRLERWQPLTMLSASDAGGVELLVLEGGFRLGDEDFSRYSWLRLPPGDRVGVQSGARGCTVWVKSGHLRHVTSPTKHARDRT